MRAISIFSLCIMSVLMVVVSSPAGMKAPDRAGAMEEPCGLAPGFPGDACCAKISSPYGSRYRYDGSERPAFRFGGRHGGIDLSLDEGTPILAIASGTVIAKGSGGQMEGNYLWLRHTPEETGLSYWLYTKYQHLRSVPGIAIGTKVTAGQEIARSGKTGTTGGYYGVGGYPHLHLTTVKIPNERYEIKGSAVQTRDSMIVDPLSVYRDASVAAGEIPQKKTVIVPCVIEDGRVVPEGARVVWPVSCKVK